jgi:hypothetical protein
MYIKATIGIENPKVWRYFDFGDVTKAPLVCIPPAGGSADIFFKLFNELPVKGIRVIGVCFFFIYFFGIY